MGAGRGGVGRRSRASGRTGPGCTPELLTAAFHTVYQLVLQHGLRAGRPQPRLPAGPWDRAAADVRVRRRRAGRAARRRGGRGVLLVVAGILLISLGGARAGAPPGPGVVWGVGTGVAIAAYTLWDNHAVNALDVPPLPYFVLGLVLQLPGADPAARAPAVRCCPTVWREARGPGDRGGGALADGLRAGAAGPAARARLAGGACPGEQHRGRRPAELVGAPRARPRAAARRRGRRAGRDRRHRRGPGSEHVERPELHADPRADGPGGLGDGVLPGALAGAAHHDQVAVARGRG